MFELPDAKAEAGALDITASSTALLGKKVQDVLQQRDEEAGRQRRQPYKVR